GEALDPLPAGSPLPLVCCAPSADPMPIALSRQVLVEASIQEIPSYGTAHRCPARLTLVRLERALRERWRRRQVPLRSPGPARIEPCARFNLRLPAIPYHAGQAALVADGPEGPSTVRAVNDALTPH